MKKQWMIMALVLLTFAALLSPSWAKKVTQDEALKVARNWTTVVVSEQGSWGDSPIAEVVSVQEFERNGRVLGYFCRVRPRGYVIVSLYRPLEPVKAFSETSDLDPSSEQGMADLIKDGMERVLRAVEKQVGNIEKARMQDIEKILEIDYRRSWERLEAGTVASSAVSDSDVGASDYVKGEVLLTSEWSQGVPYNEQCPYMSCEPDQSNGRALVGCLATAMSQVMRYWCWPPYGVGSDYADPYDWRNMPDDVYEGSPQEEIDAVAELCHEVGLAVSMDYGCDLSGAYMSDAEPAFEDNFRYSTDCVFRWRDDYTATDWWEQIRDQVNANRPLVYRVTDHAIVCDGWDIWEATGDRIYHMNYGWDDSHTTWYVLDALHLGDVAEEGMCANTFPNVAMDTSFSGTFVRESFPYRYFTRDSVCGLSASFGPGQLLQFLPNVTLTCTSTTGSIRITGAPSLETRLYTRAVKAEGMRIDDGWVRMDQDGSLILY